MKRWNLGKKRYILASSKLLMNSKIRWGILGCGNIAHAFALSLKFIPEAQLLAIASRTPGKAQKFGKQFGVELIYTTYEELVENSEIDVIYIATTHNFHYKNILLCLQSDKPVLCEKSFTLNAEQAIEVIDMAREKKIFLMEAMWMKFNPGILKLREIVADGIIGDIRLIKADFGKNFPRDLEGRIFNKHLAGGALLDLGIYPISFARMIFGHSPIICKSEVYIGETGVDEESAYLLEFDDKKLAMLYSSLRIDMPSDATIFGTKGMIMLKDFFHPSKIEWRLNGKRKIKSIEVPYDLPGYQYEILEVHQCLATGQVESKIMPWSETIENMRTMDALRKQWGLKYPEEI